MIDFTKIAMSVPRKGIDKIIGTFEGQINVAAPTALQQVFFAENLHLTDFQKPCLTSCIYSLDGGATWNDDNMTIPDLSGPLPVFQTVDVSSFSRGNNVGIACSNWYNTTSGSGTARTVTYKIYCLARKEQGATVPIATRERTYFKSTDNYLKILDEDIEPYSLGISGTAQKVFSHEQSIVPSARGFVEYVAAQEIWPLTTNQFPATGLASLHNPVAGSIKLDETSVTYDLVNFGSAVSVRLHWRAYLDG